MHQVKKCAIRGHQVDRTTIKSALDSVLTTKGLTATMVKYFYLLPLIPIATEQFKCSHTNMKSTYRTDVGESKVKAMVGWPQPKTFIELQ